MSERAGCATAALEPAPAAPKPPTGSTATMDALCVNTLRTLAMDAVQRANSGHPGTPMALAPVAYALWQRHLRFDPQHPIWPNRDRFVLSAGAVTARVSVEQGGTLGWARYVGRHGASIGMETFGASAPLKELQKKFGFVVENVVAAARAQIARRTRA